MEAVVNLAQMQHNKDRIQFSVPYQMQRSSTIRISIASLKLDELDNVKLKSMQLKQQQFKL